jgi:hypothetical protein
MGNWFEEPPTSTNNNTDLMEDSDLMGCPWSLAKPNAKLI